MYCSVKSFLMKMGVTNEYSYSANELDMFLQVYFTDDIGAELLSLDDKYDLDEKEEPSTPIEFDEIELLFPILCNDFENLVLDAYNNDMTKFKVVITVVLSI